MQLAYIVFIAFTVSADGFSAGFRYGRRRVSISALRLFLAALWSLPLCMITMLAARFAGENMNGEAVPILAGMLFIAAGAVSVRESVYTEKSELSGPVRTGEANILGIIMAMDSSMAAFSLGLLGTDVLTAPVIFTIMHFLFAILGKAAGITGAFGLNQWWIKAVPGMLLILTGLLRVFGG